MRYALDILSILTVVPKTQLLLSEAVAVLDEGGSSVSTVGKSSQCSSIRSIKTHYGKVAPIFIGEQGNKKKMVRRKHENESEQL